MTELAQWHLAMLVIAAGAALIVINRHRCALIVGPALVVAAVFLAAAPLALALLGVWIVAFAARGRRRGNNPMSRPYRGEEP